MQVRFRVPRSHLRKLGPAMAPNPGRSRPGGRTLDSPFRRAEILQNLRP